MQRKKALLLGIDGCDPILIQSWWKQKKLPHLRRLATSGTFAPLKTANPAQSPVVWTTIATGTNPGKHGLFDFITRDPATYLPQLAIMQPNRTNILGLRSKLYNPVFSGTQFWQMIAETGVATTVLKWPVIFPPQPFPGKILAGLGVPDLRNTLGRYAFYTTADETINDPKGDVIHIRKKRTIRTAFPGPNKTSLPVSVQAAQNTLTITVGQEKVTLKKNGWSSWVKVVFRETLGRSYQGMIKLHVVQIEPEIKFYITAIHMDPAKPLAPISYPDTYAADLADAIGNFHTLGMPEETNGFQDELLTPDAFLDFILTIQTEREKLFWHELETSNNGLFAFVFDTLDRAQHMFWHTIDKKHPINQKITGDYNQVLYELYARLDTLVGKVSKVIDTSTLFMVFSDHGFSTYRRSLHLNAWLKDKGLLTLQKNAAEGKPLFANVDWAKTQAYAVGFSSIFLNRKDREKQGIVGEKEAALLTEKIAVELLKWKDGSKPVFKTIYKTQKIYSGDKLPSAPELVVGTQPGYRTSWQTALGAAPQTLIEDNLRHWCGDHLIDPSFVSGIFFCNQHIAQKNISVYDIAPTTLHWFDLPKAVDMEGISLL